MTVAAILKHKGREIASVPPTMAIADVVRSLSARRIGAVLVLGGSNQLLGILSERDLVHALAAHGAAMLQMSASDLMTRTVQTATPATTEVEALEIMTKGRFRHLPVMDGGHLAGVISIGDVVKARIMQQECEVDSLKAYVGGVG